MTKEEARKYIDTTVVPNRYFDKNGTEVKAGDYIMLNGKQEKVYLLADEEHLGTDATNPKWIASGRAVPCEYGCYPLNLDDMKEAELVYIND